MKGLRRAGKKEEARNADSEMPHETMPQRGRDRSDNEAQSECKFITEHALPPKNAMVPSVISSSGRHRS